MWSISRIFSGSNNFFIDFITATIKSQAVFCRKGQAVAYKFTFAIDFLVTLVYTILNSYAHNGKALPFRIWGIE